jgi:hypothetical protein
VSRHEHRVLELNAAGHPWKPGDMEAALDEAGAAGWELVSVCGWMAFLRRPLPGGPPEGASSVWREGWEAAGDSSAALAEALRGCDWRRGWGALQRDEYCRGWEARRSAGAAP